MIYIDASRYPSKGKRTGVENYSYYLINELVKSHKDDICLISPRKIKLDAKQLIIKMPRLWTLLRLSWEVTRNKKIKDLFVPSHVLPLLTPKNTTITIHDVAFKYSEESYSKASRIYLDWAAKFAVKHAKNIIVPSKTTRDDLIKYYKAKAKKIHVIPLGFEAEKIEVNHEHTKKTLHQFKIIPQEYFLYIGRLEHKKNTDRLIEAFIDFADKNNQIKLVLAGFVGHGGEAILQKIPKDLQHRIIQTGYIGETEKNILLKNALCFIFPSRHEGFGLPLLEAMNANLPIIASDIPSSREVAHEGVKFFDKNQPKELTKLMHLMAGKEDEREKSKQKNQEQLAKFSWKKTADAVWKVIH